MILGCKILFNVTAVNAKSHMLEEKINKGNLRHFAEASKIFTNLNRGKHLRFFKVSVQREAWKKMTK